jgi:hypothetical protein
VPFLLGVGAEGEHKHVVPHLVAVAGDHAVALGLDAVQRPVVPPSAELSGGVLQPEAADSLGLERLIDAHRQVDELELGRENRDVEAIGGQRTQRQHRLEAGDPCAGDQDARASWIEGCIRARHRSYTPRAAPVGVSAPSLPSTQSSS